MPTARKRRRTYAAQLAKLVAEQTDDGAEIVSTLFDIMRNGDSDNARRQAAMDLKEIMAGKSPTVVEVDRESDDELEGLDLESLSDEALAELQTTLRRIAAAPAQLEEPDESAELETDDVPAQDPRLQ